MIILPMRLYFLKMWPQHTGPIPQARFAVWCSPRGRWVSDPSSWISAGLWLDRRDPKWLLRLVHKRWYSFPLVLSLLGHAPWEPSVAISKSGSHYASMLERPHGDITQGEEHVRGAQVSRTRHHISEQTLRWSQPPVFEPSLLMPSEMETDHTANQILSSWPKETRRDNRWLLLS